MAAVGNETVTLKRAPLVKDPRSGSLTRDWANPQSFILTGCSVQPFPLAEKLNVEIMDNREFSRSSVRVYAPAESVSPEPTDRFVYRGREYELFGFTSELVDLEGKLDHIAFIGRIREG